MADQAKPNKPPKHNGYDPKVLSGIVSEIEDVKDDMASEKGKYMSYCAGKREQIKDILESAKDKHGIPKTALKAVLKARELEAKAEAARTDLDGEQMDAFDLIRHALGDLADTPLGEAATAQAAA